MNQVPEVPWPPQYPELNRIEQLLKCGICYEYMETTVMTLCSHNYCSLCIRKYLHYKTQCPSCFQATFETDLHTNRILDEIIVQFRKVKIKLIDKLSTNSIEEVTKNVETVINNPKICPSPRPEQGKVLKKAGNVSKNLETPRSTSLKQPKVLENHKYLTKKPETLYSTPSQQPKMIKNHECTNKYPETLRSTPPVQPKVIKKAEDVSRSTPLKLAEVTTSKETPMKTCNESLEKSKTFIKLYSPSCSSRGINAAPKPANLVSCPICQVDIPQNHINRHLDECLKRQSAPESIPKTAPKRKPLPKLVFKLMKDAELKKKMKQHGLPTLGDRKTLENRYQRFCTLYNAECDKAVPRSTAELLKLCQDEEIIEKKVQRHDQPLTGIIKVSRNAEQNVIDEANRKYLEMNASSFNSLITSVKSRQAVKETSNQSVDLDKATNVNSISTLSTCQLGETSMETSLNRVDSDVDIFNQSTDSSPSSSDCESVKDNKKVVVNGKLMENQDNTLLNRLKKNKLHAINGQDFIDSSINSSSVDVDECITRPSSIPAINNQVNDHHVSLLNDQTHKSRPTRKRTCPSRFRTDIKF